MNIRRLCVFLKADMRKAFKTLMAYPFSIVTNTITFTIFIMVFVVALKMLDFKATLYVLAFYPVIMITILGPKGDIEDDVKKGRFEQIYNGAYTLLEKAIINTLSSIVDMLIPVALILIIIKLRIFNLNISILNIATILLIALLNGLPLGVILLGINLKCRKTDALGNIVSLAVLAQFMIPLSNLNNTLKNIYLFLSPFGGFISFAQELLSKTQGNIFSKNILIFGIILNTVLWIAISLFIYKKNYNKARVLGTLGWY